MDSLFLDGPDGFSQKGDFPIQCGPTMRKNAFFEFLENLLGGVFFHRPLEQEG